MICWISISSAIIEKDGCLVFLGFGSVFVTAVVESVISSTSFSFVGIFVAFFFGGSEIIGSSLGIFFLETIVLSFLINSSRLINLSLVLSIILVFIVTFSIFLD